MHADISTGRAQEDQDSLGSAIFIASMINVPYVFATFSPVPHMGASTAEQKSARISRTLGADWIPIMRGVQTLLAPVWESIAAGALKPIVIVPGWNGFELPEEHAQSPADERLLRLRGTWSSSTDADAETYKEALHLLRRCCAWAEQYITKRAVEGLRPTSYNHEWSTPFMWIHVAPQRYFVLLQQRQPPALLMFAYFGALLHQLDHYWWIESWGSHIVSAVDQLLGDYYQSWLEYPKQAVGAR
jgi:hypothetical protein